MTEMTTRERATNAADSLRRDLWEGGYPIDPVVIARNLGIRVVEQDLPADVSGAILKEPGDSPVIFLNKKDSLVRKRFTCAHELGHYMDRRSASQDIDGMEFVDFRDGHSSSGQNESEVFANAFAANLLMPSAKMQDLRHFPAIIAASLLGVSREAYGYRQQHLNIG